VVLQKRLLIGKLAPGLELGPPRNCHECTTSAWLRAHWDTMRHWMHARCVTSRVFEHSLEPLVNSELLSGIHRLLGAKVGRRVQSDNFKAVEHDCITIEDFVVFGSVVTMNCDSPCPEAPWRRVLKPIVLQRASNCLDHSQLMPGVTVGEAAVLGTRTLAHQDGCFPPDSISTGAVSGRSVLLRTEASQSAPPKDRAEELRVMRQLDSSFTWISFNLAQVLSAFLAYVLPQFAWVIATDLVFAMEASLNDESHLDVQHMGHADTAPDPTGSTVGETVSEYWMIWFAAFFAIEVGLLVLAVVLKWLVMGTYKAENHTFFSNFHYRWAIMLNFKGAMAPLADHLTGTAFQIWYYRAMGAKIGKNAYIAGIALEFDLLELGDGAAINDDCDATAHTVERMVLKMAPVKVEANASIFPGSVVMPGGLMEKGSLLLERSQVLKGDVVRAREVWAGQPAKRAFRAPK
jgi:acetyltransferase-like isoleucine patch superfamily enzyme